MYSKLHAQLQSTSDDLRIIGTFEEYADFYRNTDVDTYKYTMDLLLKHTNRQRNAHILDIGCGGGWTLDLLQNKCKEISLVEPNPFLREHWESKSWFNDGKHILHVYPNTIEELIHTKSFEKNSIDLIILYHCVYHLELEILRETLDEIISWLKHDGVCLITVIDDNNEFVQTVFKSVSPNYGLCGIIENILYHNNLFGRYYMKYNEVITFETTLQQYLETLKWITIQSCLNANYFPDGLSENKLHQVQQQCTQYVESQQFKQTDSVFELNNCHFIFKKNVALEKDQKTVYIFIGVFGSLLIFFTALFRYLS